MAKQTVKKTKARSSTKKTGLVAKLSSLPLFIKILIAVVLLAGVSLIGTMIYSRNNVDKLSVQALDKNYALTRWTKLGESGANNEYKYYACQTVDGGDNHYIRAIVTKPPKGKDGNRVTNLPIRATIVTYWGDGTTVGENGIADNRVGPGGLDFAFWGDEVSSPVAKIEHDGWWQAKFGGNGNVNDPEGGIASHTYPKYSALFTPGCTPDDQVHLDKHNTERVQEAERVATERRLAEEEARRRAEEALLFEYKRITEAENARQAQEARRLAESAGKRILNAVQGLFGGGK
jgi:hypothetical protein